MESVPGRRCARGQNCYHVRRLGLSEAVVLRNSREGNLCDKCKEADQDEPIPSVRTSKHQNRNYQVLETSTSKQIGVLKRELVLQLYLYRGDFWEAVRDVRSRWDIEPATSDLPQSLMQTLPPPGLPSEPPTPPWGEQFIAWFDTYEPWIEDLEGVARGAIPSIYIGDRFRPDWGSFISLCVLFQPSVSGDPSEPKLLEFADIGGPKETSLPLKPGREYPAGPLMAIKPPIRAMGDPAKEAEAQYWKAMLRGVWELYIQPSGISFDSMRAGVHKTYPEIEDERSKRLEQNRNAGQYFIEVNEHVRETDLKQAWRMIGEQLEGGPKQTKPPRDRLTCVECAVLSRDHDWSDDWLKSRYNWGSKHTAKNYKKDGRRILNAQ